MSWSWTFWHSSPMLSFGAKPCSSVKSWLLMNEVETIWLKPAHLGRPVILHCNQLCSRPDMNKACEELALFGQFSSCFFCNMSTSLFWALCIYFSQLNFTNLEAKYSTDLLKSTNVFFRFSCFFSISAASEEKLKVVTKFPALVVTSTRSSRLSGRKFNFFCFQQQQKSENQSSGFMLSNNVLNRIQLLEYPIPLLVLLCTSQKPSPGDILATKSGIIDPLVSKQPEKNSENKNK